MFIYINTKSFPYNSLKIMHISLDRNTKIQVDKGHGINDYLLANWQIFINVYLNAL